MMVADMLADLGHTVAAEANDVASAMKHASDSAFDMALLDVSLGSCSVEPVAQVLAKRNVPFAFASGYGSDGVPERARDARKDADILACQAWNARMLGFRGPAQPSPALGDALNAGYRYLEVKCLGCDTHQTVPLDIVRRPKTTPVHELERYMRCRQCSERQGRPFKRSHLVALRTTRISATNPPSIWWPGER
ncbi:hypothetical protein WN72_13275 [Bradyrhizobium arachidis]|uniref:Response regulator receiver domain-containing protein n=1 Tax=Bradyrhizobium arachidis TaxID=858423 RepID=A0AAE7P0R3_9BRAD|nr:hypothetical protein WN72_13275 [Bradyrhizobium arachidis]